MRDTVEARPTFLEAAAESRRGGTVLLLVLVPLMSWAWIVVMARDMYGPMTGASAWMMTPAWDFPHLVLLWGMWAVMMIGMMLPSAAPTIVMYGAIARRGVEGRPVLRLYALACGYLTIWAAFSLGATALQRLLATFFLVTSMMEPSGRWLGGLLLLIAGIYQMTPTKHACLGTCQSPFGFLMNSWRPGVGGAFRMGVQQGLYCLGCCWALMLLLFAGGVMNLAVIAALTAFVAFEKLVPLGRLGSRLSGFSLMASGIWLLAR